MFFGKRMHLAVAVSIFTLLSVPVTAVDEYGIRCNPGGGRLPEDGVLCLSFRSGTTDSDFGGFVGDEQAKYIYIAANERAMALDCPNKNPLSAGREYTLMRRQADGSMISYLTLKGQAQYGKHRCCVAVWFNGDGQLHKWCPDMAPLQV